MNKTTILFLLIGSITLFCFPALSRSSQFCSAADSIAPPKTDYILKRGHILKNGSEKIKIGSMKTFGFSPEFKKEFDDHPFARREMLKAQTYQYVMSGGLWVNLLFSAISFYDAIHCGKKIKAGYVCNPRPAHDVANMAAVSFVVYLGALKSRKHQKRAVKLLNADIFKK